MMCHREARKNAGEREVSRGREQALSSDSHAHTALNWRCTSAMVWTCWVAMKATTERPKRNGVMRRSRLANPSCLPRALRTSASRTAWNLLAMMVDCWRSIRLSFHASKGFGGLDGSCQKSQEFQVVGSSRPVVDSLSPYLCGHTIFWGNAETQVHMIRHRVPLHQLNTLLLAEFPDNPPNTAAQLPIDHTTS